jgi:hypothetical protein
VTSRERKAFLLRMGGMTMKEIGTTLGVTSGRAQQLVASADDRIEVAARAREWSLHAVDPTTWYHRSPLGDYHMSSRVFDTADAARLDADGISCSRFPIIVEAEKADAVLGALNMKADRRDH